MGCRCGWSSSGISAGFLSMGDKQGRHSWLPIVLNGENVVVVDGAAADCVVAAVKCVAVVVDVAAALAGESATVAAV